MKKFFWNNVAPISAVLIGIASVLGLIYFGVFVMFVGGIIQVVNALKMDDIPAVDVAIGCARVFFTGVGTVIAAWVLIAVNAIVWTVISDGQRSSRPFRY